MCLPLCQHHTVLITALVVYIFELRAYTLSYSTSPFFVLGFFKIGAHELFAGLALNHDPPDLCLLSSWDYRHKPLVPGE
jgi:hypothetical protein